jgi:hypothetical protein
MDTNVAPIVDGSEVVHLPANDKPMEGDVSEAPRWSPVLEQSRIAGSSIADNEPASDRLLPSTESWLAMDTTPSRASLGSSDELLTEQSDPIKADFALTVHSMNSFAFWRVT